MDTVTRAARAADTAVDVTPGGPGGPGTAPAVRPSPPARRDRLERLAPLLLGAAAVVMLPALALLLDRDAMDGWGLAGVLPVWAWFGIGAAVGACAVELLAPDPRVRVLTGLTGILVLATTGLPSVVEPGARFAVSWTHLGFVEAVAGSGRVPVGVDSRFSWAGFFAQWAWISDAAGGYGLDIVLRWAPVAIVAVWATGVYALARVLLDGRRAPWAATWLFLGLNWIEQDYFSPQATAMVLVVAVLVVVLGPLATSRPPLVDPPLVDPPLVGPARTGAAPGARLRALVAPRSWWPPRRWRPPHPPTARSQVLLAWALVTLSCAAMAVSHQLTPFALAAQLALLTVAGRVWGGRGLVGVLILSVTTWFVLGAPEFWVNQLALATGDVGAASSSVSTALGDRLVGDPGQLAVKGARVLLALATFGLGALGAWVRWRRGGGLVWFFLALAPAGLVLVQSYGGEVLLRVLLYGLPVLAILGVDALRVVVRRWPRAGRGALVVGMMALFAVLVVVRGGNDSYIALRPQEIALARTVLDQAPYGSTVLPMADQAPTGVARVGEVNQTPTACPSVMEDPVGCVLADRPIAVYSLPTMDAQGVALEGRPRGWTRTAVAAIAATGQYRVTWSDGLYAVLVRNDRP